jgi:pimeloyl-ACP methyl ester carboxylesterase
VTDAPATRYTRSADGTNLAYQVSGDGPIDMVFLHGAEPIDLLSDDPGFVRVRNRLDRFSRTVWFDRRGQGASEGVRRDSLGGPIADADIIAVFDAVGFERPALAAEDSSGLRAIHFAVINPERVSALVLVNSYAHYVREDDYPWGLPPKVLDRVVATVRAEWGMTTMVEIIAPSRATDERFRGWHARLARSAIGPDLAADTIRASFEADVRPFLPGISVPTLVLHREGNRFIHLGAGRYIAEHIPNARLVVLPGDDHLFYVGDTDTLVDEIEEFLTGARSGGTGDVRTTTILFRPRGLDRAPDPGRTAGVVPAHRPPRRHNPSRPHPTSGTRAEDDGRWDDPGMFAWGS